MAEEQRVSVERTIAAPADKIFEVLADPKQHPVIDGSGTVKSAHGNPGRLALGSKFGMGMRMGMPYMVRNKVVEFDEGKRIGWCHPARAVWRYELFPAGSGTRVVETFDWSQSRARPFIQRTKFPQRNKVGMERTLERLDKLVTTGSAD